MTEAEAIDIVREELDAAKENGYDFAGQNEWAIAGDMLAYSAAVEDWDFAYLASIIRQVRA